MGESRVFYNKSFKSSSSVADQSLKMHGYERVNRLNNVQSIVICHLINGGLLGRQQ